MLDVADVATDAAQAVAPRVELRSVDLSALDSLEADGLVLPLYQTKVQPTGVAALVDWRLCGRLARMILDGRVVGGAGEATLLAYPARTGAARIFVFGLGRPRARSAAQLRADAEQMIAVLGGAKVTSVALALPPRPTDACPTGESFAAAWLAAPGLGTASFAALSILHTRDLQDLAGIRETATANGLSWRSSVPG